MKANNILSKIVNKRIDDIEQTEQRFKKIVPLLKGTSWYVLGENTIVCPLDECKEEILDILKDGYGLYDDGRGEIRTNGLNITIYYNSHGTQQLTFFDDVWGIDLLDDWIE